VEHNCLQALKFSLKSQVILTFLAGGTSTCVKPLDSVQRIWLG